MTTELAVTTSEYFSQAQDVVPTGDEPTGAATAIVTVTTRQGQAV